MSRGRKLLIVGLVLLVGIGLAWPFRKTTLNTDFESLAMRQALKDVEQAEKQTARPSSTPSLQLSSPAPHVAAKMANMKESGVFRQRRAPAASFDLANHPALASPLAPRLTSPVTPPLPPKVQPTQREYTPPKSQTIQSQKYRSDPRLAYSTIDQDRRFDTDEQDGDEVRHVVQNSDTLEKLAKRYLGDEGRALEIFDLNRDLLDNPHLLPIGAELQIPARISAD